MLYHFLDWLNNQFDIAGFGVFKYITFRAILAVVFSLLISLFAGKQIINLLRRKLIGESIRGDGPSSHKQKAGTPTMGGIIILAAIAIPTLLWADLSNMYVILILVSTLWIGAIGFVDDYIKVFRKDKAGLKGKFKIFGQIGLGLIVGFTMVMHPDFQGKRGAVFPLKDIRPGADLTAAGFQHGDILLKVDGKPFDRELEQEDEPFAFSYTVERGIQAGNRKIITVEVPSGDREKVSKAMFSDQDSRFVTRTNIPFIKNYAINYGHFDETEDGWPGRILYVLIVILIVTAVSNAVNLTDGIDGLAAGTSAVTAASLAVFCYVSGNIIFADYLNIFFIPMSAELVIFCASLVGACVGFLWYNAYPAQVFMGDTGSLALGGAIGVLALMVKKELLIPIMCGIYFVESLSVIGQVAWFKYTKRKYGEGRRIFRMAPIHHHYELGGMHESKIVTRFWIIAVFLSVLAFATLKLR